MGLSRNKVSLRERGDGSPPFYGERGPTHCALGQYAKRTSIWSLAPCGIRLLSFERSESLSPLFFENRIFVDMFFLSLTRKVPLGSSASARETKTEL